MEPLGKAAARVVEKLAAPTDLDRAAEKAIVGFLQALGIEPIEVHGCVYLCGQFWSRNRAGGRTVTSYHVDVTAMAEAVITELQLARRAQAG
jgi:hypothetical protein